MLLSGEGDTLLALQGLIGAVGMAAFTYCLPCALDSLYSQRLPTTICPTTIGKLRGYPPQSAPPQLASSVATHHNLPHHNWQAPSGYPPQSAPPQLASSPICPSNPSTYQPPFPVPVVLQTELSTAPLSFGRKCWNGTNIAIGGVVMLAGLWSSLSDLIEASPGIFAGACRLPFAYAPESEADPCHVSGIRAGW